MRILAVDDDPVILDLLRGSLTQNQSYELTCCESGEKAMDLIEDAEQSFDCLLLDIMLPGIDGIELCDWVRQQADYRTKPIVMITASKDPELMGQAFSAGATDFLLKPLDGVELGARINSMAMLNDSLYRERAAQDSINELSAAIESRFEEAVKLTRSDTVDMAALENDLLRLPAGCYAMSLFCIDVAGMGPLHKTVKPVHFRANLEMIGLAINEALRMKSVKLAYAGSGRFVGVLMGRGRLDTEAVAEEINATLVDNWDINRYGAPMAPEVRMCQVGNQRIWSGLSASDKLREHLESQDILRREVPPARGYSLFASEPERAVA